MQSPNYAVGPLFVSNLHVRQILKMPYPFIAKLSVPQELKKSNNPL